MDPLNEKKWFVYVDDHHEGPFSVHEVQEKIHQNSISTEQYVWAEGMQDWKPMLEIEAFKTLIRAASVSDPSPDSPSLADALALPETPIAASEPGNTPDVPISSSSEQAAPTLDIQIQALMDQSATTGEPLPIPEEAQPLEVQTGMSKTDTNAVKSEESESKEAFTTTGTAEKPSAKEIKKMGKLTQANLALVQDSVMTRGGVSKIRRVMKTLVFVTFLVGIGFAYQQGYIQEVLSNPQVADALSTAREVAKPALNAASEKLVQYIPALAEFFSPIPKLSDVSEKDFLRLKAAALSSASRGGLQTEIALATSSLNAPVFYVATPLPDGAFLDLSVEGVGETLLNTLEFKSSLSLEIQKKLVKSKPLTQKDGNPIPKGEYKISVSESERQPPAVATALASLPKASANSKKIYSSITVFLGGPKDQAYQERLKEFHDKIRERAKKDIEELRQYFEVLKGQYNESYTLWNQSKSAEKKGKATWSKRSSSWEKLQASLKTNTQWSPEKLQSTYYPGLYEEVRKGSAALVEMHQFEGSFFYSKPGPDFNSKLIELQTRARDILSLLSGKIDFVEKSVIKNNELPKKLEGY